MDQTMQSQSPIPIGSKIPKYLKYAMVILGIVALVVIIVAGIYVFWFFYDRTRSSEAYNPTITMSGKPCDFSIGSTSKYFSATIKTSDVEKTRQNLIDLAERYNAIITSSSVYAGSAGPNPENSVPTYYPGSGNLSIYIPTNQADQFIKEVRKIAVTPNQLNNDYAQTDIYDTLKQWCQQAVDSLVGLQSKEKLYLEQIKNQKAENVENLINDLTQARSDAQYYVNYIKDLVENKINKFGVNLTIEEIPGG